MRVGTSTAADTVVAAAENLILIPQGANPNVIIFEPLQTLVLALHHADDADAQFDFERVMRAITVALLTLEKAAVTINGQPLALFGSTHRDRFFEHARGHAPYTILE